MNYNYNNQLDIQVILMHSMIYSVFTINTISILLYNKCIISHFPYQLSNITFLDMSMFNINYNNVTCLRSSIVLFRNKLILLKKSYERIFY